MARGSCGVRRKVIKPVLPRLGDTSEHRVEKVLPAWVTPALIDETLRVWNPWYKGTLSREHAVEILRNTARLLEVA